MTNRKLKACMTEDELINFYKKHHETLNIITNYSQKIVSIPQLSEKYDFCLDWDSFCEQVKNCGYKTFNRSIWTYKKNLWNSENYLERVLVPSFVKAFTLLMVYSERIPTPEEFLKFYIKACCVQVHPEKFEFQEWCDWNKPEHPDVILPPKKPFSYMDLKVRINNLYCGLIREVGAGLLLYSQYQQLQKQQTALDSIFYEIIHDLNLDMYHDTDLMINISKDNKCRTVHLAFFDHTERGLKRRKAKIQQNKGKCESCDFKISMPTHLSCFNAETPNTQDISGVELYTQKIMQAVLLLSIDESKKGEYILHPNLKVTR